MLLELGRGQRYTEVWASATDGTVSQVSQSELACMRQSIIIALCHSASLGTSSSTPVVLVFYFVDLVQCPG